MRETEILRGLGRAKANPYAKGVVRGPGSATSDSIDAKISDGEAVLPATTVAAVGPNNIARLIEETNGAAPQRGLRQGAKFADGYVVRQFPDMETAERTATADEALKRANTSGEQALRAKEQLDKLNTANQTGKAAPASGGVRGWINGVADGTRSVRGAAPTISPEVKTQVAQKRPGMNTAANVLTAGDDIGMSLASNANPIEKALGVTEAAGNVAGGYVLDKLSKGFLGTAGATVANIAAGGRPISAIGSKVSKMLGGNGDTTLDILRKSYAGADGEPTSVVDHIKDAVSPAQAAASTPAQVPAAPTNPMQDSSAQAANNVDTSVLRDIRGANTGISDGNGQNVLKLTGGNLKSPLYTNINPAQAVSEYNADRPGSYSVVDPATGKSLASSTGRGLRGGSVSTISSAAMMDNTGARQAVSDSLRAAAARGDWDAVSAHYANKGETFNGVTPEQYRERKLNDDIMATALTGGETYQQAVGKASLRKALMAQREYDQTERKAIRDAETTRYGYDLAARAKAPTALDYAKERRAEEANTRSNQEAVRKNIAALFPKVTGADGKEMDDPNLGTFLNDISTTANTLASNTKGTKDYGKWFNATTNKQRSYEDMDQGQIDQLKHWFDTAQRVKAASKGIGNALAGNNYVDYGGDLSQYDLSAPGVVRKGDTIVFPNGAKVNVSDLMYADGPANPWWIDSFRDRTTRYIK